MTAMLLALALVAPSSFVALDEVDPTILQDMRLKRTMEAAGFEPYANEWWHFTLRNERYPDRYFDFPVVWPPAPGS